MKYQCIQTASGLQCIVRKHRRAKHLRITVKSRNNITVTIPQWSSIHIAKLFVNEKEEWILEQVQKIEDQPQKTPWEGTREEYHRTKELAKEIVEKKIQYFNSYYQLQFKKITIRNQQTIWGSCTRAGNLNFSYRLIFLPEKCIDYIIVHELCHLKELNHGKNFWKLVEHQVPDHKEVRTTLRQYR